MDWNWDWKRNSTRSCAFHAYTSRGQRRENPDISPTFAIGGYTPQWEKNYNNERSVINRGMAIGDNYEDGKNPMADPPRTVAHARGQREQI